MAPHGKMDVIWVGNTLFVNIDEPINIEAAVLFSKKIQAAVKSKNLTQWNRYVTLSPTTLGGPDVARIAQLNNEWCFKNGCVACAILITCAPQQYLYGKHNLNCRFFNEEKNALNWLSTQKVPLL